MINTNEYKYIVNKKMKYTTKVVEVQYKGETYLVDPNSLFTNSETLYNKEDSQYELFLSRVNDGTPIKNFKTSKYYNMYMRRVKNEYPELLLKT